ncbi:hypothetical protein QUF72_21630 [Desulfobacterales bacterium HSG2]|nr:hypothetical protein [Desulfobacterales bacterium HSG2]
MDEKKAVYIIELSPEERELLETGKKVRDAGHDPVKVLNYYLEAQRNVKKAAELGKQAQGFLLKHWEAFEEALKEQDGKTKK